MEDREFRKVLALVGQLSESQVLLMRDELAHASQTVSDLDEVHRLIERRFEADKKCPHCGNTHLRPCGKRSGLRRWSCTECLKSFNALTGTPLARLRKKEQWLSFAKTLTQSLTVRKAAKICDVADGTSFLWRHRFLENEKQSKCQSLKGIAEADETFFFGKLQGPEKAASAAKKKGRKG